MIGILYGILYTVFMLGICTLIMWAGSFNCGMKIIEFLKYYTISDNEVEIAPWNGSGMQIRLDK